MGGANQSQDKLELTSLKVRYRYQRLRGLRQKSNRVVPRAKLVPMIAPMV